MIEVEGKTTEQPTSILINLEESYSYIDPNLVEIFHLLRRKHNKSCMV